MRPCGSRCHHSHYKPASGKNLTTSLTQLFNRYYIICSYLGILNAGYKLLLLSRIAKNGSPASPTRKPSPAKAASSVYTGAGPIRACKKKSGVPTIAVTQAKSASYKHICASDPENVCTLLTASPANSACRHPTARRRNANQVNQPHTNSQRSRPSRHLHKMRQTLLQKRVEAFLRVGRDGGVGHDAGRKPVGVVLRHADLLVERALAHGFGQCAAA